MTKRANILCRLFGHRYDPIGAEFYCVYHCERCGHDDYQRSAMEWLHGKLWRLSEWIKGEAMGWREWWRCSECGGRYGRHDDSPHIQF